MKKVYSEKTIDGFIDQYNAVYKNNNGTYNNVKPLKEVLKNLGCNPHVLEHTIRKGMEEYIDGLVEIKHTWKPNMLDGTKEQKQEIYDHIQKTVKKMDVYSESYISAVRLISGILINDLKSLIPADCTQEQLNKLNTLIDNAKTYDGLRYDFQNEDNPVNAEIYDIVCKTRSAKEINGSKSTNNIQSIQKIVVGHTLLDDALNLLEDATTPEVYEGIAKTRDFPEQRIANCFHAPKTIEAVLDSIKKEYGLLKDDKSLTKSQRIAARDAYTQLKNTERNLFTKITQSYAELQFKEKAWSIAYKSSIASTFLGVYGAAYTVMPVFKGVKGNEIIQSVASTADNIGFFLFSAFWTIFSGLAVYTFTDAGPKTAKWIRKKLEGDMNQITH